MKISHEAIQLISAPSVLGLQSFGVEFLADRLLAAGLAQKLRSKLSTDQMAGMSVTIYNPTLDPDGQVAATLSESIGRMFT